MMELVVEGMHCQHCVDAVRQAVAALPGAGAVEVELASGLVRVSGTPDPAAVRQAIAAEGYEVQEGRGSAPNPARGQSSS